MRIGVVFPQTELGGDAAPFGPTAQRIEGLGFTHLLAYDHVVGADPEVHTRLARPVRQRTTFHEPLVMFGYLAALTTALELVTRIIILPQRQTALVAKQAAEVDLLTQGRFRLGVGFGWNPVEYEALGEPFTNRGPPVDEQIDLIRRLWTERTVTFEGDALSGNRRRVGAAARAAADTGVDRCQDAACAGSARGGWPTDGSRRCRRDQSSTKRVRSSCARRSRRAGIPPPSVWKPTSPGMVTRQRFADELVQFATAGATHVSVNTMGEGLRAVDEHLDAVTTVADICI